MCARVSEISSKASNMFKNIRRLSLARQVQKNERSNSHAQPAQLGWYAPWERLDDFLFYFIFYKPLALCSRKPDSHTNWTATSYLMNEGWKITLINSSSWKAPLIQNTGWGKDASSALQQLDQTSHSFSGALLLKKPKLSLLGQCGRKNKKNYSAPPETQALSALNPSFLVFFLCLRARHQAKHTRKKLVGCRCKSQLGFLITFENFLGFWNPWKWNELIKTWREM